MNKLNDKQFLKFTTLIYDKLGIHIGEAKREMVQAKVSKLMRNLNMNCFDQYYEFLITCRDHNWQEFVDEITIHKTNFFREINHFDFIRDKLNDILKNNQRMLQNNEIRVWSAGCSTGKEAYTLAIILKEYLPQGMDIKILATDVSSSSIAEAQKGNYTLNQEDIVNAYFLDKYFSRKDEFYKVAPIIKQYVTFRLFNLMDPFPFQNNFDIIFCRNVMIYFDNDTQEKLIRKFYNVLTRNGLLFIGHSESLNQKQYKFKYIQPTIYARVE